jgi:hypothetical protein
MKKTTNKDLLFLLQRPTKKIAGNDLFMWSIGLTFIAIRPKNEYILIDVSHSGNMEDNLKSINENLAIIHPRLSLTRIKKMGNIISEDGSPDYQYNLTVKIPRQK